MYVIHIFEKRPSGHAFTGNIAIINHEETLSCVHAKEHVTLLLKFLDLIAYDCGVRQGEFKELEERVEMIKQLIASLEALPPRKFVKPPLFRC